MPSLASAMSSWPTLGHYFAPKAEFNPFTRTWSLDVEEQFYLMFPVFLFLGSRPWWRLFGALARLLSGAVSWPPSTALGGCPAQSRPRLSTCSIRGSGSLAQAYSFSDEDDLEPRDFYTIRLAAHCYWTTIHRFDCGGVRGCHRCVVSVPWAMAPVIGTLGVLAIFHEAPAGPVGKLLSQHLLVVLGRLSYSLCLGAGRYSSFFG